MFRRILVAARGEIALRIIRCCREMGIETVAVYSTADKDSLPVMLADRSVCIGPPKAEDSYLNRAAIIETAVKLSCEALHPGYGFLSENPEFASQCEKTGIAFIGPSAEIIRKMGDKQAARALMESCGIRVVPGSSGLVPDVETAAREAEAIGYPLLVKAAAGGGGKGMRKALGPGELERAFLAARAEAGSAFGSDGVYLEKLILHPRHIEIQILGDRQGNLVCLGERNCSVQKNNQKLLEEAPAFGLSEGLRRRLGEEALKAAAAAGYYSAGTVEFVLDREDRFYFIEMNTRIQVEHPVTEELTGVDIVREQINIAAHRCLRLKQTDIHTKGHVIECRINASSVGTVNFLHFPAGPGVRVESHLYNGCKVTPYYDPMVAKVIVRGPNRLAAIRRMRRALGELMIEGVETNTDFMNLLTWHTDFVGGHYDTSFWEKNSCVIEEWNQEGRPFDDGE